MAHSSIIDQKQQMEAATVDVVIYFVLLVHTVLYILSAVVRNFIVHHDGGSGRERQPS